jgi:ABC-type bacteriocin/lantibiotic exporter with double-glycine peptidase domain
MKTRQIILITVVGLAILGLLNTSPWDLLKMIGIVAIMAVIFYYAFRFFQRRRNGSWQDYSRYRKAVMQSKKRLKQNKASGVVKKPASPTMIKRKSNVQLTVIDGKKNSKKKNRALH